jgi:hypothetical protein
MELYLHLALVQATYAEEKKISRSKWLKRLAVHKVIGNWQMSASL